MASKNSVLSAILTELGWSINRLTAEINSFMGSSYISRSAVCDWINQGRVPHYPLPTVVAHMLSGELGRDITIEYLWQGEAKCSSWCVPANAGLDVALDLEGTTIIVQDWLKNSVNALGLDQRIFLARSNMGLTTQAWRYVDSDRSHQPKMLINPGLKNSSGLLQVIEQTIGGLRELDDMEGGIEDNLRFVHRHFTNVLEFTKINKAESAMSHQYLAVCAQLAQLAGWIAYDAHRHGLAQRYWFTGLHTAHVASDIDLAAHILGCMTYQAVYRGSLHDGIALGNATLEASQHANPKVRSLALSRFAYAQAAIGNLHAFRQAIEDARELLHQADSGPPAPSWTYWYNEQVLDVVAGQNLLTLLDVSSRNPRTLLLEAESIITPSIAGDVLSQRDALYHGLSIAHSCLHHGQVEKGIYAGRLVLDKAHNVRSPRSLTLMRRINDELSSNRGLRNHGPVIEFRDELAGALAG